MIGEKYITVKDLCELYGVTKNTVANWRNNGLPYEKIGTRIIRFKLSEVEAWLITKK